MSEDYWKQGEYQDVDVFASMLRSLGKVMGDITVLDTEWRILWDDTKEFTFKYGPRSRQQSESEIARQ
jgi:hypothetical protein